MLTDLDLHCLQRQDISGFSRTRVKMLFSTRNCSYFSTTYIFKARKRGKNIVILFLFRAMLWHLKKYESPDHSMNLIVWSEAANFILTQFKMNWYTGFFLPFRIKETSCDFLFTFLHTKALLKRSTLKGKNYSEPSLQQQHLFLKTLPLKWIRCCTEYLMSRLICKKGLVLFLYPHRTCVLNIC